jgi:glyoxylate reductase
LAAHGLRRPISFASSKAPPPSSLTRPFRSTPASSTPPRLLDAAGPQLRVVANFAVGYDNIDLEACHERDLVVTNTPDVLTNATAELTVALMLAAARGLGSAERVLRTGGWTGWEPVQFLGRELADSTVGIVGLGRIGSRVAELLAGFQCRVIGSSRSSGMELDDLLAEADIVSLHLPLNPETHHLINATKFERFKPGAILVNTSRGGLVDTDALIAALRSGHLGGAALDVFENEPDVPPELVAFDNIVLTPHIGSATEPARNGMARLAAENVIAVLEGRPPITPVK